MVNLKEIITDIELLRCRVVFRDGFAFTALANIGNSANVFDAIIVRNPINAKSFTPKLGGSSRTLQEHIDFINRYALEKAVVIAEDINFLKKCPSLKYLQIIPSDNVDNFDFSPLYQMPNILGLNCSTEYGMHLSKRTSIDYRNFKDLLDLDAAGVNHLHLNQLPAIQRLKISRNTARDLSDVATSDTLTSLDLTQCGIRSLLGISRFINLSTLALSYNRSLSDLSELAHLSDSLKSLSIDSCPKITDFTFLTHLENLEFLELVGSNNLQNLQFLAKTKKLKCFIFSMNVLDGDLSFCLSVPYAYSKKNRKHYNLADCDLPKNRIWVN